MLELGEWLATSTVCYRVSAYQAMLPAALKSKVSKQLVLQVDPAMLPLPLQTLFSGRAVVAWDEAKKALKKGITVVKEPLDQEWLSISYETKEHTRVKKVKYVEIIPTNEDPVFFRNEPKNKNVFSLI